MDLSIPYRSRPPILPQYLGAQPRSLNSSEYDDVDHEELGGGVQPTQDTTSAEDDSCVEYTTDGGDDAQQVPHEYSDTGQLGAFDAELVQNLLRRLEELEIENAQLQEDQRLKVKEPDVNPQVFHTVARDPDDDGSDDSNSESGDESNVAGDGGDTFLSEPRWDVHDGKAQLRGLFHVPDPDGYVERKGNVSFVVYKCYDIAHQRKEVDEAIRSNKAMPEPIPERQEFLLISEEMIQAVKEFFDQDPAFRTEFPLLNERKRMRPPFIWWYHYRKTLDTSQLQPRQSQLVSAFTNAIDESYGSLYNKIDDQFSRGLVSPASIQYLIRPGSVLVSKDDDTPRGHLAQSHPIKQINLIDDEKKMNEKYRSAWDVPTTTIMYKGELFWAEMNLPLVLKAESDHTEIAITSLPVMPIEYASSDLQQQLENRGKHMFWRRRHGNLVSYEENSGKNKSISQRFMIDFNTYKELHSDSLSFVNEAWVFKRYYKADPNEEAKPPELYLFPSLVPGFNFRTKKWTSLKVDLVRTVEWNDKAFGSLVADEETKEMIQALVTNQLTNEKGTDLIDNKGNGLILLLHGPPGTGKTYTAESVAEIARKPLYPVTCGDIGTKPEAVEKYLGSVFHLGKTWDCVVLLDEAEVFLEQRTLNDLERNALVSVFLRTLEYYDGILILTTNRVGTFDEAFKSRISLALRYDKLNEDQRKQIWWNFLRRLEDLGEQESVNLDDLKSHVDELASYPMNGRQIRNSISTGRQLAKYKKTRMEFDHLKRSITLADKFDKYLAEVREGDTTESSATRKDGRLSDEFFAREDNIR
ncbi:hypothetical protein BJ166DRAFT_465584 [Pestalotiopsis sp. NC0098]|nr:hypothetical protein BJ166DRAFT_465584 [Pestalotiopsis sp. NC0098]